MQNSNQFYNSLKTARDGRISECPTNYQLILNNDPLLKGRLIFNTMSGLPEGVAPLPWSDRVDTISEEIDENGIFPWTDNDFSGLLIYMNKKYGLNNRNHLKTALDVVFAENKYNPVKTYMNSLKWDGINRLETMFIDYLGAEDNEYVRYVTKLWAVGAVARTMQPGVKFDIVPILCGDQGVGKSLLPERLTKSRPGWLATSITRIDKSAIEKIQGALIVDLGEIQILKRDPDGIKDFVTLTQDKQRNAYKHYVSVMQRRCVFIGSTNDTEFLNDATGERRWMPVDCKKERVKYHISELTDEITDQLWAEAVNIYNSGFSLILPQEIEDLAASVQKQHSLNSSNKGEIIEFLSIPIPEDWDEYNSDEKRAYYEKPSSCGKLRTDISAIEIWFELYGHSPSDTRNSEYTQLNKILRSISALEELGPRKHKKYGSQRTFRIDHDKLKNL